MDKYINNCSPECDGAKVYTMCPFHGSVTPTQAGWGADNDFVANLYGLLRGMDTPRKNEVLNFIEHTVKKVEATAHAEGAKEERERTEKLVEKYFGGIAEGKSMFYTSDTANEHVESFVKEIRSTHLSEEIKKQNG